MQTLNRWNYETHSYDEVMFPDDFKFKTYSNDMEKLVHCPHCLQLVKFGECYTSMEFHTEIGFGYSVCKRCYDDEWIVRQHYKNKNTED